jgi:hypothetical protein
MSENTNNTLFINATRNKLRIASSRGTLQVEDLWDLSLEKLNEIAINLDETLQKQGRKSFIGGRAKEADEVQLQFDIVKYVIDTKLEERALSKVKADRAGQVAFLKGLQEKKQIQALENMSAEEIAAKLAELGVTE